jgi:hypothetical protein
VDWPAGCTDRGLPGEQLKYTSTTQVQWSRETQTLGLHYALGMGRTQPVHLCLEGAICPATVMCQRGGAPLPPDDWSTPLHVHVCCSRQRDDVAAHDGPCLYEPSKHHVCVCCGCVLCRLCWM